MYLDPGFGGMLLQIIVALVTTVGVLAFTLRRKIAGLFKKKPSSVSTQTMSNKTSAVDTADNVIDTIDD